MRYIDPDKVEELLPRDWAAKVENAKTYVKQKALNAKQKTESEGKTPEEVASAVLYLASPESAFVVGSELILDGGMSL